MLLPVPTSSIVSIAAILTAGMAFGQDPNHLTVVSREGQTTADMANRPTQRVSPFPESIVLLESLGAKNNHSCVSC